MIVVASQNQAFAQALAQQLVRELAVPCECAFSMEEAVKAQPLITVTDEPAWHHADSRAITISPPVKLAELLRTIRLMQQSTREAYTLPGGALFDARLKQITTPASGAEVSLTDKEARLLEALLKAGRSTISREELLQQVWGIEAELNTHTLETHIYRLRGKLGEIGGSEWIEAASGGYRMML
jgi:hypothetical protein